MGRIIGEWVRRKLAETRWLANMQVQTFHETGGRMVPVGEGGSDTDLRGKPYRPWIG